ncbi:MAG: type II secretion system protein GspG [Phycisphaerales bacterium]
MREPPAKPTGRPFGQDRHQTSGDATNDLPPQHTPSPPRAAGFSLLELMLVVVIMGILMGTVIISLSGQAEKAKKAATIAKMRTVKSALAGYSAEFGSFPPTEMGLQPLVTNKTLEGVPLDGWKRPMRYLFPGTSGNPDQPYDLISAGGDGAWGTADDLNIWLIEMSENAPPAGTTNP